MEFPPLYEAVFIRRINRFVGEIEIKGRRYRALIRNTGRLIEILYRGNRVFVSKKDTGKCPYEIVLATDGDVLVCIDSHIAPKLLAEAIQKGVINYGKVRDIKFEVSFNSSRFDMLVEREKDRVLLEVKSVNIVKAGVGLFPDAPTDRGRRHIRELMKIKGGEIAFVVQREDALCFAPYTEIDGEFDALIRNFKNAGKGVRAFVCDVNLSSINIKREIPLCF